jgi:hypothetical protein
MPVAGRLLALLTSKRPYARIVTSMLPADTRILSIGIHPRSLDYSSLPDGVDEAALSDRIERGNTALRKAGFDVVHCLVDTSQETAAQLVWDALDSASFGLVMIGGGIRMIPEHTELLERIVNVVLEASPGIRFCFNTAPDNTVDALRRWITPRP